MGDLIAVSGYGKLSVAAQAKAPLLVVFGGKTVDRPSGEYMWDFMGDIKDRYHIFVAVNHHVHGDQAYEHLTKIVDAKGLAPAQKILYLFSGGWFPGKMLLDSKGDDPFSLIFLVDIWMKAGSASPDFYKALANKIPKKLTYVYTSGGAVNNDARDTIVNALGSQKAILVKPKTKDEDSMDTHMGTNTVAVGMLP